jgi:hypothetical protein
MRRFIFAIVLGIAAALVAGGYWWNTDHTEEFKGSGILVTEPREVGGFTALDLSGMGTVRLTQGDNETLTVRTDDNILPLIKTEVRAGTLFISIDSRDHHHGISPTHLSYEVGARALRAISVAGVAEIDAGPVATDDLRVNLSGAARATFAEVTADALHVTTAGGHSLAISGTVDEQAITIDGVCDYQAKGLASRATTVEIIGTGHVVIRVGEELNITINGAGEVEYLGSPVVNQHVLGGGVVRQITE